MLIYFLRHYSNDCRVGHCLPKFEMKKAVLSGNSNPSRGQKEYWGVQLLTAYSLFECGRAPVRLSSVSCYLLGQTIRSVSWQFVPVSKPTSFSQHLMAVIVHADVHVFWACSVLCVSL